MYLDLVIPTHLPLRLLYLFYVLPLGAMQSARESVKDPLASTVCEDDVQSVGRVRSESTTSSTKTDAEK